MKIVSAGKLGEECSEIIDGRKMSKKTSMKLHSAECNSVKDKNKFKSSCTIYVVLIVIVFTICIGIGTYFIYYKNMTHDKKLLHKYGYVYQASNY